MYTAESPPAALPSSVQHPLQGRFRGLLLLQKPSPLSLRPSASGFHKKSIPLHLQGKAPPCHITGLSPGLTRNTVLRMEISFGKLQYLALELVSLNPPRPALSCLEIAPLSQLTFEERGIGNSACRRSRPAKCPMLSLAAQSTAAVDIRALSHTDAALPLPFRHFSSAVLRMATLPLMLQHSEPHGAPAMSACRPSSLPRLRRIRIMMWH